ncbi:MAG: hypothetical protein KDA31_03400 [Phycisphaerales bacterium]|nr:hypothetical protein [Phycisphaerales bacterium]MCB9835312.1 hypothetical protein [Phycisphaera sp.]
MKQCLVTLICILIAPPSFAQTATIDPDHRFAWAENIGWVNWLPTGLPIEQQVKLSSTYVTGFIWSENAGWIDLGQGPVDGVSYSNQDTSDYGVNISASGHLSGYAWGENIGWVVFDTSQVLGPFLQEARIDRKQRRLRGYLWAENVGWINLDDLSVYVALLYECVADVNGDGSLTPADFSAWVAAFNQMLPECDQNSDGMCTPADFSAWVANFNMGCSE